MKKGEFNERILTMIEAQTGDPDPLSITAAILVDMTPIDLVDFAKLTLPTYIRGLANGVRKDEIKSLAVNRVVRRGHSRAARGRVPLPAGFYTNWAPFGLGRLGDLTSADAKEISDKFAKLAEANAVQAEKWAAVADEMQRRGVQRLSQIPISDVVKILGPAIAESA